VVPPDVTIGVDEVEDGAVVVVVLEVPPSDDGADELLVVVEVVRPVWADVALLAVVEEPGELEPGCSRATTTAITAVAPVTASTPQRDTTRSRDCALALLSGPITSGRCVIDQQPLLAERVHPNSSDSTPAQDALCASCDIPLAPGGEGKVPAARLVPVGRLSEVGSTGRETWHRYANIRDFRGRGLEECRGHGRPQ
jgi:hypothetical protein